MEAKCDEDLLAIYSELSNLESQQFPIDGEELAARENTAKIHLKSGTLQDAIVEKICELFSIPGIEVITKRTINQVKRK